MFWKIFAWINLIVNLPLLIATIFIWGSSLNLIDAIVIIFNYIPLIIVPLLFANKIYVIKHFPHRLFVESVFIFTIIYNSTQITNDLVRYGFSSIPGFLFDMFFYILIILSIASFALYIMAKYKIPFFHIFIVTKRQKDDIWSKLQITNKKTKA